MARPGHRREPVRGSSSTLHPPESPPSRPTFSLGDRQSQFAVGPPRGQAKAPTLLPRKFLVIAIVITPLTSAQLESHLRLSLSPLRVKNLYMLVTKESRRRAGRPLAEPPPLQNGDRLRTQEFLRRYEAMPELKKAELIEGVVYMGSQVSAEEHSEPDGLIHGWLWSYATRTPGVRFFPNATVILDTDNALQPDACLCLNTGQGGRTRITPKKYLAGSPELVTEIAASSASIDLHDKMEAYARNGVAEYLVWRTLERRCDWFILENEKYHRLIPNVRGLLRSRAFPGLVLDVRALLAMDAPKVLTALQRGLVSAAHKTFVASLR